MSLDLFLRANAIKAKRKQTASGVAPTGGLSGYAQYQNDPVRFGVEVLGEEYTDDVKAVMESVRDYPITIARSANATGKSHGAARIAMWFYKAFPGAQVYTTAAPPENNLRRILWGEIGTIYTKHPNLFNGDRYQSNLHIQCSPQQFITGLAIPSSGTPAEREAKFSGKHAPYLLFIVDEGDAVPVEVYRGIESCLSGGMGRLLIMFNPRSGSGHVYNMERSKQANVVTLSAFRHPNVLEDKDIFPGAVTRQKTLQRIHHWTRPLMSGENPNTECFEVPEFLVGTTCLDTDGKQFDPLPAGWRKILNPQFSYMVLGEYPAQSEQQLINRAWIDLAVSRWQSYVATYGQRPPTGWWTLGLDVAEFGKDNTAACFRDGNFVDEFETWNGVDPDKTAIRAAGMFAQRNIRKCYTDGTGVGAGVAPRMERMGAAAYGVKVSMAATGTTEMGEFAALRDQLWWAVREWLRKDLAMIPPNELLIEELAAPTYEIKNGKIKIMSKDIMRETLGRSPDLADALCLTFANETVEAYIDDFPFADYRG